MYQAISTRVLVGSLFGAGLLAGLAVIAATVRPTLGFVPLIEPQGRWFWLAGFLACLIGPGLFQLLDPLPQLAIRTAAQRRIRYEAVPEWPTGWAFPFLTLAAGTLLLGTYHSRLAALAVVLWGFLFLLLGQLARLGLVSANLRVRWWARLGHTLLLYGLAFVTFAMVYVHKLRTLYSSPVIFLLAAVLFFQLTEGADIQVDRRVLYGMVGGLILAEVAWILNYWPATGWLGGTVMLAAFHVVAGLVLARVERTLTWQTTVEYSVMAGLAFAIILWAIVRSRGG